MKVTVDVPDATWWVLAKKADDRGVKVGDLLGAAIVSLAAPRVSSANRCLPVLDGARREEMRRYWGLNYSVAEITRRTPFSREQVVATLTDMGIDTRRKTA